MAKLKVKIEYGYTTDFEVSIDVEEDVKDILINDVLETLQKATEPKSEVEEA